MTSPYVVCGATGNVGSKVAKSLLAAGVPVRAVGRERVRLGPLAATGAEPWPGDLGDAKFLSKAFSGAGGVFAMIPPKYDAPDIVAYQNGIGEALVSALENARIPRVVTLSSIGAHLFEGTGPIRGLHDLEKKLDRLGNAEVVHLRAAYFMENHLWNVPVIRERGVNGSPIRPDAPIPMVATKDIADEAARTAPREDLVGAFRPVSAGSARPDDDRGHADPRPCDREAGPPVHPVSRGGSAESDVRDGDVRQRGRSAARDAARLQRRQNPPHPGTERVEHDADDPGRVRGNRLRPLVPGGGVTSRNNTHRAWKPGGCASIREGKRSP